MEANKLNIEITDKETQDKLFFLAANLHKNNNSLLKFLINDYYEKISIKNEMLDNLNKIKGLKVNSTFNREDIYEDEQLY